MVRPDNEGRAQLLVQNLSCDTHKLSIGTPVGRLEALGLFGHSRIVEHTYWAGVD